MIQKLNLTRHTPQLPPYRGQKNRGQSQYLKELLQLDHQLPVGLLQVVAEVLFAGIDRFAADLQNRKIKR